MLHQNHTKSLPFDDISSYIEESSIELQKAHRFLLRANTQPMLLFKEAHIYLQSSHNIVTKVMTTSLMNEKKVNPHSFQIFLASLLDKEIQTWAKKNGISHDIRVFVTNESAFPSIFSVYVNEQDITQFNIFERWYGFREALTSEEEVHENVRANIASLDSHIEELEERIKKWEKIKKHPISFIQTPKDIYRLLFKRKQIKQGIEKKMNSLEKQREQSIQNIKLHKEGISKQLKYCQEKTEYRNIITSFFEEISYSLEDNRLNLY